MKSSRILTPITIFMSIAMVFLFISCFGGGGTARLDGTWTLTTIPNGANPDVGDGTYTVEFSWYYEQANIEYYAGSGVIGGVDYKIYISKKFEIDNNGNDYYLFLYKDGENLSTDSIKFYGLLSENSSASGQYVGQGNYAGYGTGTFSTIKQ